jgi:hypothetical protein
MTIDLASRRSIRKIAQADFAAYPVWEWAINEGDPLGNGESFLRPTSLDRIPAGLVRHYVVSATARLSDGTTVPACVEVDVRATAVHFSPMFILLQEHQLAFGGAETLTVLSHFTRRPDTRALSWQLAVLMDGRASAPAGEFRLSLLTRFAMRLGRTRPPSSGSRVLVP